MAYMFLILIELSCSYNGELLHVPHQIVILLVDILKRYWRWGMFQSHCHWMMMRHASGIMNDVAESWKTHDDKLFLGENEGMRMTHTPVFDVESSTRKESLFPFRNYANLEVICSLNQLIGKVSGELSTGIEKPGKSKTSVDCCHVQMGDVLSSVVVM